MRRWSDLSLWAQIATILGTPIGIVAIVVTVLVARREPPASQRDTQKGLATIMQPPDGCATDVDYVDVKGTAPLSIESGNQLWILVEALDQGRWYPHGRLEPTVDGDWARRVGIGPDDVNRDLDFRIMLAECSQEAVLRINQARDDPEFNLHGMRPLETGVEVLAAVTVRRLAGRTDRRVNTSRSLRTTPADHAR